MNAPLLRSLVRQTFSVRNLPAGVVIALVAAQFARTRDPQMLEAIGMMMLLIAFPLGAIELIAMDRDGRLDQMRLAAWSPMRLGLAVFTTSGALWLATGCAVLAFALRGTPISVVHAAAIVALPLASTAAALGAVAARATRQLDPRVATAGAAAMSVVGAGAYVAAVSEGLALPHRIAGFVVRLLSAAQGGALIIALELSAIVFLSGLVLRVLRRPAAVGEKALARPELLERMHRRLSPLTARGLALGWRPAGALAGIWAAILAVIIVIATIEEPEQMWTETFPFASIFAFFFPLFFGAAAISSISREDADYGRLDVLRLSPRSPGRLAVSAIASLWLPYAVAAAALLALVGSVWQAIPIGLAIVPLITIVVAPLAVVEGWSRCTLLTLLVPATLFAALKAAPAAPERGPSDFLAFLLPLAAVAWIPWALARETIRDPLHATIRGVGGVAVGLSLAFAVFWPPPSIDEEPAGMTARMLALSAVLLFGGSWLPVSRRPTGRAWEGWAAPAGVGLTILAITLAGTGLRFGHAAALAVTPAFAFQIGRRIHATFGDRPNRSLWMRLVGISALLGSLFLVVPSLPPESSNEVVARRMAATTHAFVAAAVMMVLAAVFEVLWLLRRHKRIPVVARR